MDETPKLGRLESPLPLSFDAGESWKWVVVRYIDGVPVVTSYADEESAVEIAQTAVEAGHTGVRIWKRRIGPLEPVMQSRFPGGES